MKLIVLPGVAPGATKVWNSKKVNTLEGALTMLCSDVSPRTSAEPVVGPLLNVRKSEKSVTAKYATRAMLILDDLHILGLDRKGERDFNTEKDQGAKRVS